MSEDLANILRKKNAISSKVIHLNPSNRVFNFFFYKITCRGQKNQHSQESHTNPSNVSTTSSPTQPSSNELSNSISNGAPQVEVGDYVAVYLEKYDPEQPQIGKITSISSMDGHRLVYGVI